MSRGDLVVSMVASFSKGDQDGFIEDCNALISYEESKKNFGLASRIRKALEGDVQASKPSLSAFSVAPLETKRLFKAINEEKTLNELISLEKPFTSIDQVILQKDTETLLKAIIEQWQHRDKLIQFNLSPQNRILLYGPPGTGKTFAAYGIANALGLDIAYVRFDALVSSYLGQTGTNLREVFEYVSRKPCILLLDELDAIGKKRDDNHELGELKRIVISLLQNLDSFPSHSILIACTNHQHLLDDALWRRFDVAVPFEIPKEEQRAKIIENRLIERNVKLESKWVGLISKISGGLSAANLVKIIDNAIRKWAINNDHHLCLLITEEISRLLSLEEASEIVRVNIAQMLRSQSRRYTLSYLSQLLNMPKSTLHKRLQEQNQRVEE